MGCPKMVIFDYGHTLLYEPGFDALRGERALFEFVTCNRYGVTPEQANDCAQALFERIGAVRKSGYELHQRQYQRFLYEYLGLELSITPEQAETVFWDAAAPGAAMPRAEEMLGYLNGMGVRTAVISNISWSGDALRARLNRLLPDNRFEFVMASSDYMFRKPDSMLFELALRKAGLRADEVWYCGDNARADVEGASRAGIFPVWYDNDADRDYIDRSGETKPECAHLYIKEWDELIDAFKRASAFPADAGSSI